MTEALFDVVNDPNGTAYPARDPSLDVAGKTGTAQTGLRGQEGRRAEAGLVSVAEPRLVRELRAGARSRDRGGGARRARRVGARRSPCPVAMQIVHEYERLQSQRLGRPPSAKIAPAKSGKGGGRPEGRTREAARRRRRAARAGARALRLDALHHGRGARRHRRHQPVLRDERRRAGRTPTTTSSRFTGSSAAASSRRWSRRSTTGTTSGSATRSTPWASSCSSLVFILGREIRGSSRWIYIGSYSFQPSEFMKLFLVIALAKYLHDDPKSEGRTLQGPRGRPRSSRRYRRRSCCCSRISGRRSSWCSCSSRSAR